MSDRNLNQYEEEDLISNTFYIFLLLVCSGLILGGIIFGVRESYLNRSISSKKSQSVHAVTLESTISSESYASKSNLKVEMQRQSEGEVVLKGEEIFSKLTDSLEGVADNGDGDDKNNNIYNINDDESNVDYQLKSQSTAACDRNIKLSLSGKSTSIKGNPYYMKLDVISSGISGSALSPYIKPDVEMTKIENVIKYSLIELQGIENEFMKDWKIKQQLDSISGTVKLDGIQAYTGLPKINFNSIYEADKMITRCTAMIMGNDICTGIIGLVTLISIGYPEYNNSNYFLDSFSSFMIDFLESGNAFNYLEQGSHFLQKNLITLILTFIWSHYIYVESSLESANQIQSNKPNLLNVSTTFRSLTNLKLGTEPINMVDVRIDKMLTKYCEEIKCNDYLSVFPIIGSVSKLSEDINVVHKYYQLILLILTIHVKCCMQEYINDKSNDTLLKQLVQHGLGLKNQPCINDIANKIYYFLLSHDCDMEYWLGPINNQEKLAATTTFSVANGGGLNEIKYNGKIITPGSWNINELTDVKRSTSLKKYSF